YFVFVGSLHPRKNLSGLFKAFDDFKSRNDFPHQLLIIGNTYWWNNEIKDSYQNMKYKESVVFSPHLENEKLNNAIASSEALIYPSFFEGFGIPILEGMSCEVPVITSNLSSMQEVSNDAALLIDPYNIESISQALNTVVCDKKIASELIDKGKQRIQCF
ncbi:MAG: glycosyltransferase family 4 protein, partial [Flavobacteriales bacterium]